MHSIHLSPVNYTWRANFFPCLKSLIVLALWILKLLLFARYSMASHSRCLEGGFHFLWEVLCADLRNRITGQRYSQKEANINVMSVISARYKDLLFYST